MIIKVERKIYNTETAELIAETAQGSYGDSRGFEEKLYKRGPKDYFLYGHGGEDSPYPEPGLFVLSVDDAREWLLRVAGPEAVEKEFGTAGRTATKKAAAREETAEESKAAATAKKAAAGKGSQEKAVQEESSKATREKAVQAGNAPKAEKTPRTPKTPKNTKT